MTLERGQANGILFIGTDGKVEVNRGYFRTWPEEIGQEPIGPNDLHLYESPGHQVDWLNCVRSRKRPICDVAIGAKFGDGVPPGQYLLLVEPADQVGSRGSVRLSATRRPAAGSIVRSVAPGVFISKRTDHHETIRNSRGPCGLGVFPVVVQVLQLDCGDGPGAAGAGAVHSGPAGG